ncbi:MAG: UDP-N-acetylglucosamine--N-acetylmuramyl-(pentapeptide) pyrophosphoryl-undecaprenol N-acetylglucosamine transferase [Syntrophorhabdaceae bacterium]|nr:UDP-N-acetylglucosamine--N-acetylmuramyl-(pentapeptide) pyrophosphoryl-undecaprenol N-acetylglucosamine transferase [Syntrophorhabdaceae bacterium]
MSLRMIVAGGGTGGHVFPGIALAEAFLSLCPGGIVAFVGTREGLEARAVPARGFEIDFVPSGQVTGKGLLGVLGLLRIVSGIFRAVGVLRRRRPDLVFGVGGYASVPVAAAAVLMRVPLFLQEQNSVPGRSNRLLARFAVRVFAGFEGAVKHLPQGRTERMGNPLRAEIVAAARAGSTEWPPEDSFTVLAIGGSRGARAINSCVLEMARAGKKEGKEIRFLLQTGESGYAGVEEIVRKESLMVEPFAFTDRMGEMFPRCHAVLMRAGALSISEAALFGRPCVLVPFPSAADDHQTGNAREFCAAGAGIWMPESDAIPEAVRASLWSLAGDRNAREKAREASLSFARPDAALETIRGALALFRPDGRMKEA